VAGLFFIKLSQIDPNKIGLESTFCLLICTPLYISKFILVGWYMKELMYGQEKKSKVLTQIITSSIQHLKYVACAFKIHIFFYPLKYCIDSFL
jgi:hypothetical protein